MIPPRSFSTVLYWARPTGTLARSLVTVRWRTSNAPPPSTMTLPRCIRSNRPTASRTARCSASVPSYWMGMSHPANGPSLAPRARCSSSSGVRFSSAAIFRHGICNRPPLRPARGRRYDGCAARTKNAEPKDRTGCRTTPTTWLCWARARAATRPPCGRPSSGSGLLSSRRTTAWAARAYCAAASPPRPCCSPPRSWTA